MFVLNPQLNSDNPYNATKEDLFADWNETNLRASVDHFEKLQCAYLPMDKSNEAWEYNFNRKKLQDQLGENYFVPRLFFFKTKKDNKVITLTSWTEHIPNVIPPADYFLLTRQYKKLFWTVKDTVLISKEILLHNFGSYFDNFEFNGCKIIHPENSIKVKDKFNSLKSEQTLEEFAERITIEHLYNAKPS